MSAFLPLWLATSSIALIVWDKALPVINIDRHSAYLIGRDSETADIVLDHPGVWTQHAVIQFCRTMKYINHEDVEFIRPYIIDFGTYNGTYVNRESVRPWRRRELNENDKLQFGNCIREFVLRCEKPPDDEDEEVVCKKKRRMEAKEESL
ncbi:unnamed protein product [Gongylonema pulchrum]|uniref:FHA domain-containing protein n=1 Tax=Gongylonema pulchrum TaxID=637853 RepID=A0A183EUN9_9BILA|nr:unnamed protein product [Gongylonema pulchrum]